MKFIARSKEYNTIERHVNAPFFKRVFDCDNSKNAKLTIVAVGLYRLFLNGEELNKSFFAPYMSNPDQVVVYDVYDIENKLKKENNVLCVLLGNGFVNTNDSDIWLNESAPYRSAPKFALKISKKGKVLLETDEKFVAIDSPITFDDFRCGERYDARLERKGVLTDTDLSGFEKAILVDAPKGRIVENKVQPIVEGTPKKAVCLKKTPNGYLYDFGANNTGLCLLHLLDAEEGQRIDMYFAEEICEDGSIDYRSISFDKTVDGYNQHDVYVCRSGEQSYLPSFTWHGFRYCEVCGLNDEQATLDAVEFVSAYSDLPKVCNFRCDNETVNKLVQMTIQSDRSNFVFYPYDCPQREKNGWTADASLSAEQMLYTFDAKASLEQWLLQIRNAQKENGMLPGIIPTAGWGFDFGNGPAWDSVIVELPYQLYRFYGDEKVVKDNAEAINKYFDYVTTRLNADGLANFGLGDWVQTYTKNEGDFETPVEITDSLTMIDIATKAIRMFDAVGLPTDKIEGFAKRLKRNFRKKYVCDDRLVVKTQTALAMALQTSVLTNDESVNVYRDLIDLIHGQDDHFRVGVVGYKYLFDTLVNHGDVDLCFKLITQKSFPSYGYWIEQGATTLWESFEEYEVIDGKKMRKDGMKRILSFNHHFWGAILAWFYRNIGWLDVADSKSVRIKPILIDGVNSANIAYARGGKSISIDWERVNKHISLNVDVKGFECVLVFPNGKIETVQGKRSFAIDEM